MIWGWEGGGASEGQSMLLPAYWWTSVKSHTGLRRRHGAWQTDAWQNSLELAEAERSQGGWSPINPTPPPRGPGGSSRAAAESTPGEPRPRRPAPPAEGRI
jgi:hypothetical protein